VAAWIPTVAAWIPTAISKCPAVGLVDQAEHLAKVEMLLNSKVRGKELFQAVTVGLGRVLFRQTAVLPATP
jgi:hypothetical protein